MFVAVRCFVAVWPPAAVLDVLEGLPRPVLATTRWSTRDQWHVTLRFFGELDQRDVARAVRHLREAAQSLTGPMEAEGGPATRFLGPGLVIWPVAGLGTVARAVERATAKVGEPAARRPFRGHLTIARARGGADLRGTAELLTSLASTWQVSSFALVESQLRPGGASYHDIEVFGFGAS
jgi:RNA 2',3'-cyclic 3'-phosphodiesterase